MRDRHWEELTKVTGKDLVQATTPEFTLTTLRGMGLDDVIEQVSKVREASTSFRAVPLSYLALHLPSTSP